jgi:hypothetical protein
MEWCSVKKTYRDNFTFTLPNFVMNQISVCNDVPKTKYMIMSRHPNSGQNQNIRIDNELFEHVAKFKYLGTTLTNQNDVHDVIKIG